MYKKGEQLMYPKFGLCKIVRIFSDEFNGEQIKYYELSFKDMNLSVSIPVEKADSLGVRYPSSKKELIKKLERLNEPYEVIDNELSNIIKISNEKISSGRTEDAIELICLLRKVFQIGRAKNKPAGLTDKDNLRFCIDFLRTEVELMLGEKASEKYGLI